MRPDERMTAARAEALLDLARRGEDALVSDWEDGGVDLEGTDEEIREDVAAAGNVSLTGALEAATTVRNARIARRILYQRYLLD